MSAPRGGRDSATAQMVQLFQKSTSTKHVGFEIDHTEENPIGQSMMRSMTTVISASLPVQRLSRRDGIIADTVTKVELAKQADVHLRDLRMLDDSQTASNRIFASIKGFGKAILFVMESLKVLIMKDEALVFSPDTPAAKLFLKTCVSEFETYTTLRFEHELLEVLMNVCFMSMSMEFTELDSDLSKTRASQEAETSEIEFVKRQLEMFPKKSQLQLLRRRVMEVTRELCNIQADDVHLGKLLIEHETSPVAPSSPNHQGRHLHNPGKRFTVDDESLTRAALPHITTAHHSGHHSSHHTSHQSRSDSSDTATNPMIATSILNSNNDEEDEEVDRNSAADTGSARQNIPFSGSARPFGGGGKRNTAKSFNDESDASLKRPSAGPQTSLFATSGMPDQFNSTSVGRDTYSSPDNLRPSISVRGGGGGGVGLGSSRSQHAPGTGHGGAPRAQRRKQSIQFSSRPTKDLTFDIELVLDNAIIRMCHLENEIDDLIERITAHEAEATLQVDIVRNRIIKYNTFMTMATFGVAVTAVVPGIFGMNLLFPGYLYTESMPFYITCMMVTLSVPVIFLIQYWLGKRMKCF